MKKILIGLMSVFALNASIIGTAHGQAVSGEAGYKTGKQQYKAKNYEAARISFKTSCREGYLESCMMYGNMLYAGRGGSTDKDTATSVYQDACDKGNGNACAATGHFYYERQEFTEALGFMKTACENTSDAGCHIMGNMYRSGEGTGINEDKAIRFYTKACDANFKISCAFLAEIYNKRLRESSDQAQLEINEPLTKQYFAKVCELGVKNTCGKSVSYPNWKRLQDIEKEKAAETRKYEAENARDLARLKRDRERAVKSTRIELKAYEPGPRCRIDAYQLYSDDQSSIDRSLRKIENYKTCYKNYLRREAKYIDDIVGKYNGQVTVSVVESWRSAQFSFSAGRCLKCESDLKSAVNRLVKKGGETVDKIDIVIAKHNEIIENGY